MRHLYRNTASGAEAAGCAHGAHGAHSGVHTPDVSCFSNFCFTQTVHVSEKFRIKSYMINFFAIFSESPKMPKKGQKRANFTEF